MPSRTECREIDGPMSPKVLDGDPGPWDHPPPRVCARGRCTETVIATRRMPHAPWGPDRMTAQTRSRLGRRLAWLVVLGLSASRARRAHCIAGAGRLGHSDFLPADIDGDGQADQNPTCGFLDGFYGGGQTWLELEKIDGAPTNGTFGDDHDRLAPAGRRSVGARLFPSTRSWSRPAVTTTLCTSTRPRPPRRSRPATRA